MKKLLKISSPLVIIVGIIMVVGGIWGVSFTYSNVVREKITTPDDASIPGVLVRGPFTLKSQADIIRTHTLNSTNGKTFAEMPSKVPELDQNGKPVLDENGESIMVANTSRNIWITATTLITALNFAIVAYAFSSFIILFGLVSVWVGLLFIFISRRH